MNSPLWLCLLATGVAVTGAAGAATTPVAKFADDAAWNTLPVPAVAAEPATIAAPDYPAAERDAGHRGTTTLRLRIDAEGRVQRVQLRRGSGWPALDASALAAAPAWTFTPARDRRGDPVTSDLSHPVAFHDESAEAPSPLPWQAARDRVEPGMSCPEFIAEAGAYPSTEAAALQMPEFDALIKWAYLWNGIENKPQDAVPIARNDVALLEETVHRCRRDRDDYGPFFMFGEALERLLGH